jgi:hypothetical protein
VENVTGAKWKTLALSPLAQLKQRTEEKNAWLKTTHFRNPALGKYWTENTLGYFDPAS